MPKSRVKSKGKARKYVHSIARDMEAIRKMGGIIPVSDLEGRDFRKRPLTPKEKKKLKKLITKSGLLEHFFD